LQKIRGPRGPGIVRIASIANHRLAFQNGAPDLAFKAWIAKDHIPEHLAGVVERLTAEIDPEPFCVWCFDGGADVDICDATGLRGRDRGIATEPGKEEQAHAHHVKKRRRRKLKKKSGLNGPKVNLH
jgi:hypothetical protein